MVKLTLKRGEFGEIELPCDDSLDSVTVRAKGDKVTVDVQATRDGLTWGSPVAQAHLNNQEKTMALTLPQGTRKVRAVLHNGYSKPAKVEIDDFAQRATT